MSATPDNRSADPDQRIADLERQLAEREAELAECKAERDGALGREAATARVLEVINRSPGDLDPVFDTMVDKAITLCEAVSGILWTCDGERFYPVAVGGASHLAEWLRHHRARHAAPDTPGGRSPNTHPASKDGGL